jgi:hypothetical protein
MKQEVIQDFLNLPGILGFALMDGRSRPYFYGVDRTLNFQQKEVLAQGILQVVETIPEGFESFKFQFAGHQVHIYKVDQDMILLVLTCNDLVYEDYLETIKNLKASLREDTTNAIAKFRLIAGTITQSNFSAQPGTSTPKGQTAIPTSLPEASSPASSAAPKEPPCPEPLISTAPSTASLNSVSSVSANWALPLSTDTAVPFQGSLNDLLLALNQLSHFTTRYLGTQVIVNYWKTTRPPHPWLGNFQVDRAAQITFAPEASEALQHPLSPDQQLWVQEWVAAFIKRCSQIVRSFPDLIQQADLTDEQKSLLLG